MTNINARIIQNEKNFFDSERSKTVGFQFTVIDLKYRFAFVASQHKLTTESVASFVRAVTEYHGWECMRTTAETLCKTF